MITAAVRIDWGDGGVVGVALISVVVTLMLFPFAGWRRYLDYRPPLFIGGVVFMPLFVAIAAVLGSDWPRDARAVALAAVLAGFWASAAWLASPRAQGSYVPGLALAPGLEFRPDLVLPGGVLFVKGLVLSGVGLMLMFQETWHLPVWNWWGFVLAFFGILTLIPVRGVVKMLARRARFLGRPAPWQAPARWALLVTGLAVLLYGFLAAFMGQTPVTEFRPSGERAGLAAALLAAAAGLLAAREAWKRRLPEGAATRGQRVGKQAWLYGAVLVYMYGFIVLFMGRLLWPHPAANPKGVLLGGTLLALGASLVVGLRPIALANELHGMIRVMVGMLATLPAGQRQAMMQARMRAICRCPLPERAWHVSAMLAATDTLDDAARAAVEQTRSETLLSLPSDERKAMMQAMDRLMAA